MQTANHRQAAAEVRRMRRDRGWTHDDMSDEIFKTLGARYATSARTLWRVEGGHKPSIRKQFAIASVFGTVPSQLWPERAMRAAA